VIRNGSTSTGEQKYACKARDRQFVEDPQYCVISDETKALIDRLFLKKIPLAGIAQAIQVSESWLQAYVNKKDQAIPCIVEVIDERGQTTAVYTGTAELASTCPHVSEISFEPILHRVVGVKLTIDQRRDANWCEIDAVELVGMP
jgi:hypothetical protein